jgi:hypothetical protein
MDLGWENVRLAGLGHKEQHNRAALIFKTILGARLARRTGLGYQDFLTSVKIDHTRN